ncbi:MAG: IS1 family transposase [Candidatus Methylomirabilia bacterium]
MRSISRMTGVHKTTILRLLKEVGDNCVRILDERMRSLTCRVIEGDEVWSFVKKKQRRLTAEEKLNPEFGDQYAYIALDPDTKLVPVFVVGKRDGATTFRFVQQLRHRLANRIQISTDAFRPYVEAVESAFGADIEYAQLTKVYEAENPGPGCYSPPKVTGVQVTEIAGRPEPKKTCTSYVERNNLTIRMQLRRFTRLTNGFSKKLENLKAALAIHFAHYNFCRIHGSLRVTPAMPPGVTDRIWKLEELL